MKRDCEGSGRGPRPFPSSMVIGRVPRSARPPAGRFGRPGLSSGPQVRIEQSGSIGTVPQPFGDPMHATVTSLGSRSGFESPKTPALQRFCTLTSTLRGVPCRPWGIGPGGSRSTRPRHRRRALTGTGRGTAADAGACRAARRATRAAAVSRHVAGGRSGARPTTNPVGPSRPAASSPRSPPFLRLGHRSAELETFYGAAVRSMSQSWHNFFFGAFDPWGTVSVDKLPGAFWVQALSVRSSASTSGPSCCPRSSRASLTVLVLYRAVRRVGGRARRPGRGLVLAVTPVTILLNRGNVSDSLLILLLVLAADAATSAFLRPPAPPCCSPGVWVGLAFQAKMLQAWIVMPALFMAYVVAAPVTGLARRVGHVVLAGWSSSPSRSAGCASSPSSRRTTGPTSTAAATTRSSARSSSTTAPTGCGQSLDQPGCSPPPVSVTTAQTTTGGATTVALGKGPGRFLDGTLGRDAALVLPAGPDRPGRRSWWPGARSPRPTRGGPPACSGASGWSSPGPSLRPRTS